MQSRNERKDPSSRPARLAPAPVKRFKIEKLEERIAPTKGGKGTHNCGGGSSASGSSSISSGSY